MLSRTADYALRAVLLLARGGGGPLSAEAIADAIGAPRNYTAKTLNGLAKAGLLRSVRGAAGGFVLAVPAESLTIARIVDLFETGRPNARCILGAGPCDAERPCRAHDRWSRVAAARRAPLVTTTVADLVAGDRASGAAGERPGGA